MTPKHSGLGIASLILCVMSTLSLFALIVVAGVLEASTPGGMDEDSVPTIVVGLVAIGCFAGELLALGLGIGGIFHPNRNRLFPILGTVFSVTAVLGCLALTVVGLRVD